MPDDLLNLNLGQVQAVIDGYEERFTDSICAAVWTGFYAGYYIRGKHTKKPTEIIASLTARNKTRSSDGTKKSDCTDIDAEIEKFAQRDLAFFKSKG